MRWKLFLLALLALACFLAGQFWTLWVQPELMTDVALRQMQRSDEAARAMRTANQVQQWPIVGLAFVLLAGALLIFWPDRRRPGALRFPDSSPSTNEETER